MSSNSPLKRIVSPDEQTNGFSVLNNDRPLTEEEELIERKAKTVSHWRRIHPIMGTLGFLLRNTNNYVVIEHLRNVASKVPKGQLVSLNRVLNFFDELDEFSQQRVDIFDHICRKFNIDRDKFWGWFQQGSYQYLDVISKTAISNMRPRIVEAIGKHMMKEKNFKDRELAAKMAKLVDNNPLVKIEETKNVTNNNLTVNNNSPFSNFTSSIRKADEQIRGQEVDENRLLEEGNKENFIDAEFYEEKEEDSVKIESNIINKQED